MRNPIVLMIASLVVGVVFGFVLKALDVAHQPYLYAAYTAIFLALYWYLLSLDWRMKGVDEELQYIRAELKKREQG